MLPRLIFAVPPFIPLLNSIVKNDALPLVTTYACSVAVLANIELPVSRRMFVAAFAPLSVSIALALLMLVKLSNTVVGVPVVFTRSTVAVVAFVALSRRLQYMAYVEEADMV